MLTSPRRDQLLTIARWENRLLWSILAMVLVNLLIGLLDADGPWGALALLAGLGVLVFQLVALHQFATAAAVGWPKWILLALALVPVLGLLAIVLLVVRVNRLFKDLGIKVGVMGPSENSIRLCLPEQTIGSGTA